MIQFLNISTWNKLFPNRPIDFYSFDSLVLASKKYPDFLSQGDEETQKRELAAFLASISFETGRIDVSGGFNKWGLHYIDENIPDTKKIHYSDLLHAEYPPVSGVTYHGRGPIQLSWNYNYGSFSESWFGDKSTLLNNPGLVSGDPVIAFASAIWFWMTAQFPKPSCHDIITGKWKPTAEDLKEGRLPGFGAVINVINGGLECGHTRDRERTIYREKWFAFFCNIFQISTGENMGCTAQRPFGL